MVLVLLTFHNVSICFRFSLQFKALFSNVDVIQHVKKCMKLQREAKNMDTLWKVKGFFCDTASSSEKKKTKETEETEEKKGR